MSDAFFRVSGVDPDNDAKIIFVWSREKNSNDYVLLASGHVVIAGCGVLPGIQVGQYSVVFELPNECSADSIVVTDDKNGQALLPGVSVTPCLTRPGFQSAGTLNAGDPAVREGSIKRIIGHSSFAMAPNREIAQ